MYWCVTLIRLTDTVSVSNPNAFTRILLKWQRKSHEPVPINEINKTIFFIRLNVYKNKFRRGRGYININERRRRRQTACRSSDDNVRMYTHTLTHMCACVPPTADYVLRCRRCSVHGNGCVIGTPLPLRCDFR